MNELKTMSDKIKAAIALTLVIIILSGCDATIYHDSDYVVNTDQIKQAEKMCEGLSGLNTLSVKRLGYAYSDGRRTAVVYDVIAICKNNVNVNYHHHDKQMEK